MRKISNAIVIGWNWFWLRVWVALWCVQHGRVGYFATAVAHVEERRLQEVRQGLWELRLSGQIRAERDEDGELVYYPVEGKSDKPN